MEISNIPQRSRVVVPVDDVKPNDVIYLSTKDDAPSWLVLDVGKPFILIENMRTHFACLYRATTIYKEI